MHSVLMVLHYTFGWTPPSVTVKSPYIRTLNFQGVCWSLSRDYDFKYQAVGFLNRFLIYKTLDVHDKLHFIEKSQISRQ